MKRVIKIIKLLVKLILQNHKLNKKLQRVKLKYQKMKGVRLMNQNNQNQNNQNQEITEEQVNQASQELNQEQKSEDFSNTYSNIDDDIQEYQELCKDFIAIPFSMWAVFSKDERKELTSFERDILGKRFYYFMLKHDLVKYMKEDIAFAVVLGAVIVRKISQPKLTEPIKNSNDKNTTRV